VIVAQEVTARRAVDTRLALTDRLATLGTLAAGIAHEINNPLACISANVEVAIDALSGASEPDRTRINECRAALLDAFVGVSQASTIVRTLRTFAREAPTELGELELASAVESALILAGAELRHRVTVRLDVPQSCRVRADLGRLRQVLVNVLINAAQAMPERPVHENLIHLVAGRSDDRVEITVMDNGRGMPAEVCARAFDPFFSTKPAGEGTGLGLAICRRLMREMGGEIELGSEPGVGSRVVLALPGAAPTSFIQRLGTHAERA
jgi:C4-dicarboxylate-specific signal transduction histidine kinase